MAELLSLPLQQKILAAIDQAMEAASEGVSPSAALAKAAAANGLGSGHVEQLVHAYNAGCTRAQQQSGGSLFEKLADFELANKERVIELLHGAPKTAAAKFAEDVVSKDYAIPPTYRLQRRAAMAKAAVEIPPLATDRTPPATPKWAMKEDEAASVRQARMQQANLRRDIEEQRMRVAKAADEGAEAVAQLGSYFRGESCLPMAAVQKNAKLLYGDSVQVVFEHINERCPELRKMAVHRDARRIAAAETLPATGKPYELLWGALGKLAAFEQIRREAEAKTASLTRDLEALRSAAEPQPPRPPLRFIPPDVLAPEVAADTSPFDLATGVKTAVGLPLAGVFKDFDAMRSSVQETAQGFAGPGDEAETALESLTDPEHEAALRDIGAQAILHDLMANDPIIRGHKPQEVIRAFNDVAQTVPSGVNQRLLLQTALRQHLQQGVLNAFDVDQLLGVESKLRRMSAGAPLDRQEKE